MSRHVSQGNNDGQRNDSALSLAFARQPVPLILAGRHGPAASWSSYNLRQDSLTDSVYETPASSIYEYDTVHLAPSLPSDTLSPSLHKSTLQASSASSAEPSTGVVACGQCYTKFTEEPASTALGAQFLASRSLEDSSINVEDNDDVFAEGADHDAVSNLPVAAWKTFYEIHARLDPAKYSQLCNRLFTRWAALAQALKEQKSHAYGPFARALAELHQVVDAIDCNIPEHDPCEGQRQCPGHASQASSSRNHRSAANTRPARRSSRTSDPAHDPRDQRDGKAQRPKPGDHEREKAPDPQPRLLDCPVYKHWFMWLQAASPPPCTGCSQKHMSQIRNHIKRAHAGRPGGPIPYYHHCSQCQENFINRVSVIDHGNSNACRHVSAQRGNPIIPWARLYLKIYPDATAIPSPWNGEPGWAAPSVLTWCQQDRSFLEERSRTQMAPIPPNNPQILVNDQLSYEALQDMMLQEATSQAASMGIEPVPTFQGVVGTRLAFVSQLDDARTRYLQLLRDAPQFLLPPEIAAATSVLVGIVDIVRAYQIASMTPVALSVDTDPSADGMNMVFSDLALSLQTDQTTLPDTNAFGPSGRVGYQGSPSEATHALETVPPVYDGTYVFDLGLDIESADLDGSLNLGHNL